MIFIRAFNHEGSQRSTKFFVFPYPNPFISLLFFLKCKQGCWDLNPDWRVRSPLGYPITLQPHTYNNTKNYEITNSTHRNDLASNPK